MADKLLSSPSSTRQLVLIFPDSIGKVSYLMVMIQCSNSFGVTISLRPSYVLLYTNLLSVDDVQSLLQRMDLLALEVVNGSLSMGEGWGEAYACLLRIELGGE